MTDTPPEPGKNPAPELRTELRAELRNWCEAWKTCLQNVLSQVSGQPAAFEVSPQPLPLTDTDVWYTVVAAGAVHGEMTLRLPSAAGSRLARKFLGEPEPAADAPPEAITTDQKEALEELLRQIAGLAATALASLAGGEVKLSLSPSAAPTWSSDAIVCLQTRDEAGTSIALEIQISPALSAELQPRAPAPAAAPAVASSADSAATVPASGYRRLKDVELDVKLRFGFRHMLLRDVLALSPGVVVELETSLHSPVDLLLDGRLIAKGDVVVVDGKYGLRVTDVVDNAPSPESQA